LKSIARPPEQATTNVAIDAQFAQYCKAPYDILLSPFMRNPQQKFSRT
jgi:hypothetical protein